MLYYVNIYCKLLRNLITPDKLILVDLITILFKIFKSYNRVNLVLLSKKKSENSNSSNNDDVDGFYSKYEEEKEKPTSKSIFSSNGYKLFDDVWIYKRKKSADLSDFINRNDTFIRRGENLLSSAVQVMVRKLTVDDSVRKLLCQALAKEFTTEFCNKIFGRNPKSVTFEMRKRYVNTFGDVKSYKKLD